jgi:hypothetical protein
VINRCTVIKELEA